MIRSTDFRHPPLLPPPHQHHPPLRRPRVLRPWTGHRRLLPCSSEIGINDEKITLNIQSTNLVLHFQLENSFDGLAETQKVVINHALLVEVVLAEDAD